MIKITDFIPVGIDFAISNKELAARIRTDERTVRQLVHIARKNGAVICSTCEAENSGYYIPRDVSEALPYYRRQLSRINSATEALQSVINYIGGEANE